MVWHLPRARWIAAAALGVLAASLTVLAAPASAATVALQPAHAAPGERVTLRGAGLGPRRPVAVLLAGRRVAVRRTGASGGFAATIRVPGGRPRTLALVTRAGRVRVVNRLAVARSGSGARAAQVATSSGGRAHVALTRLLERVPVPLSVGGLPRGHVVRAWFPGRRALVLRASGRGTVAGRVPPPARPGRAALFVRAGGTTSRLAVTFVRFAAPGSPSPDAPAPGVAAPGAASAGPSHGGLSPPAWPRLLAVGDIACAPGKPTTETACRHGEVAALTRSLAPDAIAALGDLQYETGSAEEFRQVFDPTWGSPFRSILRPVPGNHEYETDSAAGGYFGYFGAAAGDPDRGWYAFDLGGWRVIALNTNYWCTVVPCSAGSEQERWLRDELTASSARCTVAFWHNPRYSSTAGMTDDGSVSALWDAAHDLGADVVLTGHAHNYERLDPMDKAGAPSATGLRQFVSGGGGKSLHGFVATPHGASRARIRDFGVLELTLRAGAYDWRFVDLAGDVRDSGTDACR